MKHHQIHTVAELTKCGLSAPEIYTLLGGVSGTLLRWYALECGTERGHVERDADGKPWHVTPGGSRVRIRDSEAAAKRKLGAIMERHPELSAYIQTDPRGCALYIIRPGDIPEGGDVSSYYTRGIAVIP